MSITLKGGEKFFAQTMATSSDEEQAAFFNEFGRLMPILCQGSLGVENQMCMLVRHLDPYGRKIIETLAAFVALDKKPE